jgi:hypothetical protein
VLWTKILDCEAFWSHICKIAVTNLSFTEWGLIFKFRPKRFHQIDSRSTGRFKTRRRSSRCSTRTCVCSWRSCWPGPSGRRRRRRRPLTIRCTFSSRGK